MLKQTLLAALAAALCVLLTPVDLNAYGAAHRGYTHVGPNGVYHAGRTVAGGPGGAYAGGHSSYHSYGGGSAYRGGAAYRSGYGYGGGGGAYGGGAYGGGAYGGGAAYRYTPSYGGAAGGYRYGYIR